MTGSLTKLFGRARVTFLAGAAFLTACMNTGTTEVSDGPFYTIAVSVADSAKFEAGSVIVVRATLTHEAATVFAAPVGWTVTEGGGTASAVSSATDSLGQASILWKLGSTAGRNTLIVATTDRADTLSVIGVIGDPSYVLPVGADSTTAATGAVVTLQARVTDGIGNNVPAAVVNWTATGGTLSAGSAASDANGVSQVTFSAATPGDYFVTATLPGRASHIYQIVVQ